MTCNYEWSTDDFPRGPLPHQCGQATGHELPHRCDVCQAFDPKPDEFDCEDELMKALTRIQELEVENSSLRSAGGWNALFEQKVKPLRDENARYRTWLEKIADDWGVGHGAGEMAIRALNPDVVM